MPDRHAPRLRVDLDFGLIQQLRLAHALAESSFVIAVPAAELGKFAFLRQRFGLALSAARPDDFDLAPHLTVAHETPSTGVGALHRPLLFPRVILDHCRSLWPAERPYRSSFAGLLTDSRRAALDRWLGDAGEAARLPAASSLGERLRRQVVRWRGADRIRIVGRLAVWSSERGRRFPTKAWDAPYYGLLAASQFVLCPRGDYSWTYRFFESCLCGAIPVVEEASPAYDGFHYHRMSDRFSDAAWTSEAAEHNYARCRERLSLPADALDRELARLLDAAPR
jgi:hypothetical protein